MSSVNYKGLKFQANQNNIFSMLSYFILNKFSIRLKFVQFKINFCKSFISHLTIWNLIWTINYNIFTINYFSVLHEVSHIKIIIFGDNKLRGISFSIALSLQLIY